MSALSRKRNSCFYQSANLSMQIHFNHQMVLIQLYSTDLILKIIEKRIKIQTKKRFHISWVHVYENAANVFNKEPIYSCKFTSFIKWFWLNSTVLGWSLKTLKNVKEFEQRNVSIFCWCKFKKSQLMFLIKYQFIHANSRLQYSTDA